MKIIMNMIENADTVVSLICGIGSIIMFILSKKQKDECLRISNIIEQKIEIFNKESSISSSDQFNINTVGTFDNKKSIK